MSLVHLTTAAIKRHLAKTKPVYGIIIMPQGIYPKETNFVKLSSGARMKFPAGSQFGDCCIFAEHAAFEDDCVFGYRCHFSNNAYLGPRSKLGNACIFYGTVTIGQYSTLGHGTVVHGNLYLNSKITVNDGLNVQGLLATTGDVSFGLGMSFHDARFGKGANITFKHRIMYNTTVHTLRPTTKSAKPYLILTGAGSVGRTTYFFNTTTGIVVRSGCFEGTIQQFRAKVKRDCRSSKSVKRLQYLGFANIACATWGYTDLIE